MAFPPLRGCKGMLFERRAGPSARGAYLHIGPSSPLAIPTTIVTGPTDRVPLPNGWRASPPSPYFSRIVRASRSGAEGRNLCYNARDCGGENGRRSSGARVGEVSRNAFRPRRKNNSQTDDARGFNSARSRAIRFAQIGARLLRVHKAATTDCAGMGFKLARRRGHALAPAVWPLSPVTIRLHHQEIFECQLFGDVTPDELRLILAQDAEGVCGLCGDAFEGRKHAADDFTKHSWTHGRSPVKRVAAPRLPRSFRISHRIRSAFVLGVHARCWGERLGHSASCSGISSIERNGRASANQASQ